MVGAAISCTLPGLEALLSLHTAEVVQAEASLKVHASEIQTGATWGLDRIDQLDLPLDGSYDHTGSESGAGVKIFVLDTGIRCTHDDLAGRCVRGWAAG